MDVPIWKINKRMRELLLEMKMLSGVNGNNNPEFIIRKKEYDQLKKEYAARKARLKAKRVVE